MLNKRFKFVKRNEDEVQDPEVLKEVNKFDNLVDNDDFLNNLRNLVIRI